jgi:transcriptional regulator with XRE-family HTH domain
MFLLWVDVECLPVLSHCSRLVLLKICSILWTISYEIVLIANTMPAHSEFASSLERQLLLQLGERLKRARQSRGLSSVDVARQVGISRTTLMAVESGEPSPTMGTYLRVMSVLGMAADLALLATGESAAQPAREGVDAGRHGPQDLQSLLLHKEAVRLIQLDPSLVQRARSTLERWRVQGDTHTVPLWDEWTGILERADWAKALANTQRGRQLRQASPLSTLVPEAARLRILADVKALRRVGKSGRQKEPSDATA